MDVDTAASARDVQQEKLFHETMRWMQEHTGQILLSLKDNDWTTIITLHAIVETTLNAALVKHLQTPELSQLIAKLPIGNTGTGKIAFAKALKILEPKTIAFIRKLSDLRNLCVHDARNFRFDLKKHLDNLDGNKRSELMNPILESVKPEERTKLTPQLALYVGTLNVMTELYIHSLECKNRDLETEARELQAQLYKQIEARKSSV
jgi:hypothetical protein